MAFLPPRTPPKPPAPPVIRTDDNDEVMNSLKSEKATSLCRKRLTVATVLVGLINISIIMAMVALNPYGLDVNTLTPRNCVFVFSKHVVSSSLGWHTVASLFISTTIVWTFAYQAAWTRPKIVNRFTKAMVYTKFKICLHHAIFAISGSWLAKSYLGAVGLIYSDLTNVGPLCPPEEKLGKGCLDERNLFICLCAGTCVLFYVLRSRILHTYVIKFPCFPQSIHEKLYFLISKSLTEASREVIKPITLFILGYYIQGGRIIRSSAVLALGVSVDKSPLDQISALLDIQFLFFTYVISTLVLAFIKVACGVVEMCLTQRLKFPIEFLTSENPANKIMLCQAVGSTSYYMRYLAYYDLKNITATLESRLVQIFEISHPGGNPKNWLLLMHPILGYIEEVGTKIKTIIAEERKKNFESSTAKNYFVDPKNPGIKVLYSSLTPLSLHGEPNPLDILRVEKLEIRNLAAVMEEEEYQTVTPTPVTKFLQSPAQAFWCLWRQITFNVSFSAAKCMSWIVLYLRTDLETVLMNELSHYVLLVWATESLTNIACCSLVHDIHGATQNSIGKIISTQIEFYEILLELQRAVNPTGINGPTSHLYGKYGLKVQKTLLKSYKASLSRLYRSFRQYMEVLQLPPKLLTKWKIALRREGMDYAELFEEKKKEPEPEPTPYWKQY